MLCTKVSVVEGGGIVAVLEVGLCDGVNPHFIVDESVCNIVIKVYSMLKYL